MGRKRKVGGWQRAARKLMVERPQVAGKLPALTFEQVAEMAATRLRMASRKKPLTVHSNLVGLERDLLLLWDKSLGGVFGDVPNYLCLCACGNFVELNAHLLLRGLVKDCGCRKAERKRLRAWRRRQRLAKLGRKRAPWKRFTGLLGV
jgi:hypothetical protein